MLDQYNDALIEAAKDDAPALYLAFEMQMQQVIPNYTFDYDLNADEAALRKILKTQTDKKKLQAELMSAINNDHNMLAAAYGQILADAERSGTILTNIKPTLSQMEILNDDVLTALSSVNGIKTVQSTTTTSMVMVSLQYNNKATIDLSEILLAIESVSLDDTATYGAKFGKIILKIDPNLLAVMNVTVAYQSDTDTKDLTWFQNEVLNKVETTVGVGSVTTNINTSETEQNQNQAWQGVDDTLVPTYSMSVKKSSNAVTTEVCANIIATLEKIKTENPGFSYEITSSQGDYIQQSIGSVGENLIIGGILAIIVLFLFLRSFKMTLAIGISIPLALVGTFVFMYFMGINLNIVSMSGLALAVGMLVDNSVVVLENIYRLRNKGMPIREACVKGASQIMMAMLASSLTTICVFFPMFFLEGLMMEIFTDLVWVVILSLACSFIVAVMFLPSIVATFKIDPKPVAAVAVTAEPKTNFWQKIGNGWRKFTAGVHNIFDKILRFAINKKWLTIALALIIFVGAALLLLVNGFILMPATDEGSFTVNGTLNAAGKSLTDNQRETLLAKPVYQQIQNTLANDIDKCVVSYDSGNSAMSMLTGSGNSIAVTVKLRDQRNLSTDAASDQVYRQLQTYLADDANLYFADFTVTSSSMISGMMSNNVSAVFAVDATAKYDEDGVLVASAYEVAQSTLDDFSAKLADKFTAVKSELKIRTIEYDQNLGKKIEKYNNKYCMQVTVKADSDADSSKIQSQMDAFVAELKTADTNFAAITILDGGMADELNDTYTSMGIALLVGFLLIYLVMVAIFQSFLMPFIILICVPLGFTGAFLLLAICQMPLSLPALIGFLILMGVVINNGILAVDYTNQARHDGLSVKEALVAAMHTRMRPIFMTALTTILAMVPMALGWSFFNVGGSTALMQPLAIVSIGGLLFGTVTTLLVVPAFYAIFCRDKKVVNN